MKQMGQGCHMIKHKRNSDVALNEKFKLILASLKKGGQLANKYSYMRGSDFWKKRLAKTYSPACKTI